MKMITKNMFLVMLFIVSFVDATTAEPSRRNVIKLSHPIHKPNTTSYSRFTDTINASQRRFSSIQLANANNIMAANNGTEARVIPVDTGMAFVATVSIGTPPVVQYLVMDTGSTLTWIQCKGCKPCKGQKGPMYDPTNSFAKLLCADDHCDSAPGHTCGEYGPYCNYKIKYASGATSSGVIGAETFTFKNASKVSGIMMGCGFYNEGFGDSEISGILGLGTSGVSILSTSGLGSKFSYCIGSLDNKDPEYHFLIVGNDAIMAGDPSPMILENGHYYVTLEAIIVGDMNLLVDPDVFKLKPDKTGGVIIDSGSSLTHLAKPAYERLRHEIVKALYNLPVVQLRDYPEMLCFNGWSHLSNLSYYVPPVVFKFANDQTISIGLEGLFMQFNLDVFCMLVVESTISMSVVGVFAQQFYNVGYDVLGKNVYFYRTDCKRVDV